jgi:hypothetical protein
MRDEIYREDEIDERDKEKKRERGAKKTDRRVTTIFRWTNCIVLFEFHEPNLARHLRSFFHSYCWSLDRCPQCSQSGGMLGKREEEEIGKRGDVLIIY